MRVSTVEHEGHDEGRIRVIVAFDGSEVRLRDTSAGVQVELEGCVSNVGPPGSPALPRTTIRIALPEGTWPGRIDVGAEETIRLTDQPTFVRPVQPLRPGIHEGGDDDRTDRPKNDDLRDGDPHDDDLRGDPHDDDRRGDPHDDDRRGDPHDDRRPPRDKPTPDEDEDNFGVEPLPEPAFVPPDPELYAASSRDDRRVLPGDFTHLGLTPIVSIELRPIRFNADGILELSTMIDMMVGYGPRPQPDEHGREEAIDVLRKRGLVDIDPDRVVPLPEPRIASRAQASRLGDIAREIVANPDMVAPVRDRYPWLDLPADYLVITDNQTWNAATITPTGSVSGDLFASFARLADWKRSRGVTSKVVTISDIVAGRYGDFRSGSRDLPEVIRSFLKWAQEHWGVAWLLLGGDVGIVPARLAAGALEGQMKLIADDPPGDNLSHWTGSFLKMHVVAPGGLWPGDWDPILVNPATGQLIPFDSTGASASGGLGWYYTTSDSYATRSTMPTDFVRVNGTAVAINAELQWLYQWNRIPTDFYYASLQSWVVAYHEIGSLFGTLRIPYVYFPPHDWDALDNGLYGQYVGGADIDGVIWHTDLSVGRAPVQTAAEADAFVDKVISYERFTAPNGLWLDSDWPRRLVIAASNWWDPVRVTSTTSDPPEDDRFRTGSGSTVVHLTKVPSDDRQLIAEISISDRRELPWNVSGGTARGWHYALSATDHSVPMLSIALPWMSVTIPLPSRWIVVHGAPEELNPSAYLFDRVVQDESMRDQEQLRERLWTEMPGWDQVSRLYKDETDLTPSQVAAAPLLHLTEARMQDALNAGPHVVSLSGHGNSDGCCGARAWMASSLTNGWHSFIGYADSCLTNQFDANDAFSEELLTNASGGAVGYVGSTRFSWIEMGDEIQRGFFHRLTTTRHLGLANDSKVHSVNFTYWHAYARWGMYAINLMGDPEMPVWRSRRRRLYVDIGWKQRLDVPVKILVREPKPGEPNEEVLVSLRQGERELFVRPGRDGIAQFDVSSWDAADITLTVSAPDAVPEVRTLAPDGPLWLTGRVIEIRHRPDDGDVTLVVIDAGADRRTAYAAGDDKDYALIVDALTDAFTNDVPIGLLVASSGDSRILRFRFAREESR